MSDMIERVGSALANACMDEFGRTWTNDVRWKFARAAIEAMREPTPHMQEAGAAELERQRIALEWDSPSIWIGKFFSAMIDSALSQSPHSLPSEDR